MKRLADYIAESSYARHNPVSGDDVDFVFNEELCVSTQVLESSPDRLVIAADETLMSLLEHCGCAFESHNDNEYDKDTGESLTPMVPNDSASPIPGRRLGEDKEAGDSPVANAIIRRIMFQHPGVLATHGPEKVMQAADEVADWVGEVDEIGSSDVSAWTRDAIRALAELPDEPLDEAKYQGREVKLGKPMPGDYRQEIDEVAPVIGAIARLALGSLARKAATNFIDGITDNDDDDDDDDELNEAKYQGREVKLGKPMPGDVKKYKVYVRDPQTGNIKKVNFGDKKLSIKRDDPKRRKNFRARHNCAQAQDRTSARYWSCRFWSKKPVSQLLKGK